jgi:predicted  nucleic acid-binding Zn-ribbon protein
MQENKFCSEHGACAEKMTNAEKEIDSLKKEIANIKDEQQKIQIQQIRDSEKTLTLYNVVGEIKDSLKKIEEKIDGKKDTFKDTMFKFALEILKYATIGGLLIYFTSIIKK